MEATYQLEREDYWDYQQVVVGRAPALKRLTLFRRFLRVIFPIELALVFWLCHLPFWTYGLLLIGCAAWPWLTVRVHKRALIALVEARPGAIGLHTMRLDGSGLRVRDNVMESFVHWENVTEITDSPQLIVLFLGPQFGYIVPKRAFPSPEQAQDFLQTAQAYRDGLAAGTAPVLPPMGQIWPPPPQRLV